MPKKRLPRPRDPVQLGKLIVDIATGQVADVVEDTRNQAAVSRGHAGGVKGGHGRARVLTAEQRKTIAKKAARTRWKGGAVREPTK